MMTISEILTELESYTGRFPRKAMEAAVEQREAITPELLRVLEKVAEDPLAIVAQKNYMLHTFALYLLAQFREKRAYPLLVRILRAPGEMPFQLFGDTITESLSRILGSVYDGNPALLQSLVESEDVNEYVRSAAVDGFLVLERNGALPRPEVATYFQELFAGRLARQHSHAWNGLVGAVADLPAPELLDDVRRAYKDGLVDSGFADWEGIQRELLSGSRRHENYTLIADAINEMAWWVSFEPERRTPKKALPQPLLKTPPPPPTQSRTSTPRPPPTVKIGRNELCPCGSGKKHKKCCLGK